MGIRQQAAAARAVEKAQEDAARAVVVGRNAAGALDVVQTMLGVHGTAVTEVDTPRNPGRWGQDVIVALADEEPVYVRLAWDEGWELEIVSQRQSDGQWGKTVTRRVTTLAELGRELEILARYSTH